MAARNLFAAISTRATTVAITATITVAVTTAGPTFAANTSPAPAPVGALTATQTITQPATFTASGVDIWSGVQNSTVSWNVANASWNTGDQSTSQTADILGGVNFRFDSSGCSSDLFGCFSSPQSYSGFDYATKTVGFAASAHTNGSLALSGRTSDLRTDAATAVSYPGAASFAYPSARSFTAGSTVSLRGDWALASGATINTATTSGAFDLIGNFALGGGASTTAYLLGASPGGAIIPDFSWNSGDQTMFSLSPFDGTPRCCPLIPISGQLGALSVRPSTVTVNGDGSVSTTGTNKFSDVTFDLDGIVRKLSGGAAPAVSRNVDLNSIGVPIQVGYNIFDAKAPIQLYADQTLTFRHDGVRIRLTFNRPVAGFTGQILAKDPGNIWVEFRPGVNVGVQTPAGPLDPITVTPSLTLDAPRLTNATQMRTTGRVDLSSGGFDFGLAGFEVFPAIGGFDTGLAYPESVQVGFECDLRIAGTCVFGHPVVSIVWHTIYAPGFGPWSFGGLSTHWGPLWGPRAYGASQTPNTLANSTQPVNTGRLTLASFQLEPNRPPVAAIDPVPPVTEGALASFSGARSSDPDGDPITYAWTFGDGTTGTGARPTHVYADNATYTVGLTVTDSFGQSNAAQTTITVGNAAPTVVAPVGPTADEGSIVAPANASFNDLGTLDTHTATVDWGDGSVVVAGAVTEHPFGPPGSSAGANGSVALGTHVYADSGTYNVRICVTDDDGARTCATFVTTVNNVPPTAILRGGPITQFWGVPNEFTADITDPSPVDTAAGFADHWNWGDGTPDTYGHTLTPAHATHAYASVGTYTARVDATDKDGGNAARNGDSKQVTIVRRPTTISCLAADATFGYASAASATLVDPVDPRNQRLLGRTVTYATGGYTWTATSNASGLATTQTPTQPADGSLPPPLPGRHTITVTFAGDVNYEPSRATCDYTVANSNGTIRAETRQGSGASLGLILVRAAGEAGVPTGTVTYRMSTLWVLRSSIVTGLGIAPDGRSAWLSGTGDSGQTYVLYVEDDGPRMPVARLWIGGRAQNGDGVADSGQVQITAR